MGTPFFREKVVELNFYNQTVKLYNKDVNSPISLDGSGGGNDPVQPDDGSKMAGGAIFGIVFAVLVVLAALFGGCYYYTQSNKVERTYSGTFPIEEPA